MSEPRCRACSIRRGVDPETALCEDCARREGVRPQPVTEDRSTELERVLAVAVIRQAVSDVATHVARHGHAWVEATAGSDAKDFLLRRLWQTDNRWGLLIGDLLHPGMKDQLLRYCNGLEIRRGQGFPGPRPRPGNMTLVATAVADEDDDE